MNSGAGPPTFLTARVLEMLRSLGRVCLKPCGQPLDDRPAFALGELKLCSEEKNVAREVAQI